MKNVLLAILLFGTVGTLSGCSAIQGVLSSIFGTEEQSYGLPVDFQDVIDNWQELGLPDLSDLADLPGLDSLPLLESLPGGIVYRGPVQHKINAGDKIPGTDITLLQTTEGGAEFDISGMRSVRVVGDSVDYDGEWPSLPGSTYNSRMRIYRVSDGSVRVAGVHQLAIPGINPVMTGERIRGDKLTFPFVTQVSTGSTIPGTTYGYGGSHDRGAIITGISEGDYPYRKMGDSIHWRGNLRPDVPVEYNIRTIHFDDKAIQVGGVVSVQLPTLAGE